MSATRQLALLWAVVALGLIALAPLAAGLAAGAPACPVRAWLDLPCLSCGTTRAAVALARLDPLAALAVNPLAAIGWLGLVGGGLIAGGVAVRGELAPLPDRRPTLTLRLAVAAALLVNWVYLVLAGT